MAMKMETQTSRMKQRPEYSLYVDGVLIRVLFGWRVVFSEKVQVSVMRKG